MKPLSTARRSTSNWSTPSAACGSFPPSSSISRLPRRFGLEYIGEDGKQHQPLMVHRALYGSIERFFGILIEHYAGAFPVWLAPVQATVLPITDKQAAYAKEVYEKLKAAGIRVELDDRSEKVNFKIREAQLAKIPYMLVIGEREAATGQVAVRNRKHGDQGAVKLDEFLSRLNDLIATRKFNGVIEPSGLGNLGAIDLGVLGCS